MSLTSKQIDELRAYAKDRKGELAKLINDAADTIEVLSAKLHASQMERSSQYYHGGWVPDSERLPEENMWTICQNNAGAMMIGKYDIEFGWIVPAYFDGIVAWMPVPEPYRGEGD